MTITLTTITTGWERETEERALPKLPRVVVTDTFREGALTLFPALQQDVQLRKLAEYLMFGTHLDETTGDLVLSSLTLRAIVGEEADDSNGCRVTDDLLRRFSSRVARIEMSDWSYAEGRARTVTNWLSLFGGRYELLRRSDLLSRDENTRRVYFDTGEVYNRAASTKLRKAHRDEVIPLLAEIGVEDARFVMDYLNNLPANRFSKLAQNVPAARAKLAELELDERKRTAQENVLDLVEKQPWVFYKPSKRGRSLRLYAAQVSVLMLKRELRKALIKGWAVEADLVNAQLAVIASPAGWDVPLVQEFLANNGSIWPELFSHFGWAFSEAAKQAFKAALYSTAFGMSVEHIKTGLDKELGAGVGAQFVAHPLIAALLSARKAQLKSIEQAGGAYNVFGQWVSLPQDATDCPNGKTLLLNNPRSVLASLAQAVELALLVPVYKLAAATDEFDVVLHIHDGICIAFKDKSKEARWRQRIQAAVADKAAELGIHTALEFKDEN